jgi:predicted acylesterase/phospholipase RssA
MQKRFKQLSQDIFAKTLFDKLPFIGIIKKAGMLLRLNQSLYSDQPLIKSLQGLFPPKDKLFSTIQASGLSYSTRVAVTAAKDKNATRCLFASYNRYDLKRSHDFEREDNNASEICIWEAARATSAAPFFFPPFKKGDSEYADGGLFANCPASIALREKDQIWSANNAPLDFLLSVGTGLQTRPDKLPSVLRVGGIEKIMASFFQNLDTDSMWRTFKEGQNDETTKSRFFRFNPRIHQYVALDEWKKMNDLENVVTHLRSDPEFKVRIRHTTKFMLASLLFFEPDENIAAVESVPAYPTSPHRTEAFRVPGTIRCRLQAGSSELVQLLKKLGHFWCWYSDSNFPLGPRDLDHIPVNSWERLSDFENQRDQILAQAGSGKPTFFRLPHEFHSSSRTLVLAVSFKGDMEMKIYPISGFPVTMEDLRQRGILV